MTHFKSLVLDVDSTLAAIEGIDWLATRRDASVAEWVARVTREAMDGRIPLDAIYEQRLQAIAPTRSEVHALADAYVDALVPGAAEAIATLRGAGVRVILLSGGLRDAILPLASHVGIAPGDVHAVTVRWGDDGRCAGLAPDAWLAHAGGKPRVLASLALGAPVIAVGDGTTDADLAPHVARFVAFTGVVRRPAVVAAAAAEARTFDEVVQMVLGA